MDHAWSIACPAPALHHPAAEIPAVSFEGLNEAALLLAEKLVRLSNGPVHTANRDVAASLFRQMRRVPVDGILSSLLTNTIVDWVKDVSEQLPAQLILAGFGFNKADTAFLTGCVPRLVQLMLPVKTGAQLAAINAIAAEVYDVMAEHLLSFADKEEIPSAVSQLTGLLIQSYDAGGGLLSNALLHFLRGGERQQDKHYLRQCVVETLRFDPPIHHTRRIAVKDIRLGEYVIPRSGKIVLVLAAANRDETQFDNPEKYDLHRSNNHTHLTFGNGAHHCMAHHFSVSMATDALYYLFEQYPLVQLRQQEIAYAPLLNARIPVSMLISLS